MVDIHTHILQDIDDGSRSLEESIAILRKYLENGIKQVVLTPHYMEDSEYNCENNEKYKLFDELNEEIKRQELDINLYLGNEVYASDNILELLKQNKIMTINNSRYILIEFPMFNENANAEDIIYNLRLSNIIPIIAHPERYIYIQKNIEKAKTFIERGALLQINKDSLFGKYGKDAEKTAKLLLKNRLVHFVGTDVHNPNSKDYSFLKFKKMLNKLTDIEYTNKILEINGLKVLENKNIEN